MRDLQVLVCVQAKDSRTKTDYPYTPIQTGKALHPDIELGYLVDNTGDNISDKNATMCEWCAHYWAWKNIFDVKYIGLCHYRRYFDIDLNINNIDGILSKKDVIVIKQDSKMVSRRQRETDLIRMTSLEDTYLFYETFLEIHPQYEKQLIQYFYNSVDSVPYSMLIASRDNYARICEFVFPVLLKLEQIRIPHGYSRENRVVGYVGEFMLGLAIYCLGLSKAEVPLLFLGESGSLDQETKLHKVASSIKYKFCRIFYRVLDSLNKIPEHIVCPPAVRVGLKNDGIILKNI